MPIGLSLGVLIHEDSVLPRLKDGVEPVISVLCRGIKDQPSKLQGLGRCPYVQFTI